MGKDIVFKNITHTTAELGVSSTPLTVAATTIPLDNGDIIIIRTPKGQVYRTEVTSNVAVGSTSIPINTKGTEVTGIHNKTPIPRFSSVMTEDIEMLKYAKRPSQMYINFSSQAPAARTWTTLSASGISNHSWNTVTTNTGTTLTGITPQIQAVGLVIPFDCTLVGMTCIFYRVAQDQSFAALFHGTPNYNDQLNLDMDEVCNVAADNSAGPDSNYSQRPVKGQNLTANESLSAGDILLPAFKGSTAGGNLRVSYTVILEYNKL
tara:strand:+ start:2453 stop:3244 length:792 start_codon:yes stop_codon:yes gene_type:complete